MGALLNLAKGAKHLTNLSKAKGLDATTVMSVAQGAVTPDKPGSWEHLAVPMPTKARQFTVAEANALTEHATRTTAQQEATARGYKAVRDMSRAFTQANVEHEKTRRVLASNTFEGTAEKVKSAAHLHQLRPGYAQGQRSLEFFAAQAEGSIAALG